METPDLIFCKIEFSFADHFHQTRSLIKIATSLKKRNLDVGLCGTDSTNTQFAEALVAGIVGGATSAGLSGPHSSSEPFYTGSDLDDEPTSDRSDGRLSDACSEVSVLEEAAGSP
jgi:hypothetical protein